MFCNIVAISLAGLSSDVKLFRMSWRERGGGGGGGARTKALMPPSPSHNTVHNLYLNNHDKGPQEGNRNTKQ